MTDIDPRELRSAQNLFRRFQYRQAKPGEIVQLGGLQKPIIALEVGIAVSIGYKAIGDGQSYYHDFEGKRPRLFVSADGKQIHFVGGEYVFTDRGFIR